MGKRLNGEPVPRLYRAATRIRKELNKGKGLQDLVFSSKNRDTKTLYALVRNSIKNDSLLERIFDKTGMTGMLNESFDSDLAKILVTELLWGKKKLPGKSLPVKITLQHRQQLEKIAKRLNMTATRETMVNPHCARINTQYGTANNTIQQLVDDGWDLVQTPDNYELFLECVRNLSENQFIQDYHFDEVLMFPPKTKIHSHKLVENGSVVLQDKASCLPVQLLNPKLGSVVLDMCAAPGMKTAHLASLMQNKGTLYAVDKDPVKFEEMKTKIEQLCQGHNNINFKLADSVHLTSKDCPGVQYILVDPSCSGTGMTQRMKDVNEGLKGINSPRIKKLSNFQERLLVQALTAFPTVERVVYTTCSTLQDENEKVLERVLNRVPSFQVIAPELKTMWERRGDSQYTFGSNCLVTDVDKDQTTGSFVALLERKPGMEIEETLPTEGKSLKRKSEVTSNETNDEPEVAKKRKETKRKRKSIMIKRQWPIRS